MLHPIFGLLVSRPELLMEHVSGYATLMRDEASSVGLAVAKRAAAWGAAALGFLLFVLFTGVAAMLAAMHQHFHWMLVVVPCIPLAAALVALHAARKPLPEAAFGELKAQLEADAQALRAISAKS